jgi:hypothetical protein
LNPKKLTEVGFSQKPKNMPMSRYVKMHKVQEDTDIVGIRKMEAKDVPIVHKKLNAFLNQFKLHIQFT